MVSGRLRVAAGEVVVLGGDGDDCFGAGGPGVLGSRRARRGSGFCVLLGEGEVEQGC